MWTFFKFVLPFESIVNCHSLFINSLLVCHGHILFGPVVHIRLNAEMSATTNVTLSAEVEGSNNRVKSKGFLLHFFWVLIMWLIKLMTLVIGCLFDSVKAAHANWGFYFLYYVCTTTKHVPTWNIDYVWHAKDANSEDLQFTLDLTFDCILFHPYRSTLGRLAFDIIIKPLLYNIRVRLVCLADFREHYLILAEFVSCCCMCVLRICT